MASVVDICNLALSHLGDQANVSSIDPPEASVQAELCKRFYPIARDFLLERHMWRFATKRQELAPLSIVSLPSWEYAFAVPSDMIRPVRLVHTDSTDDQDAQSFIVEMAGTTQALFSNVDTPRLTYIARVTDTARFSPLFVSALGYFLAGYLAGPLLKGDAGRKEAVNLRRFGETDLAMAVASDANSQDAKPEHVPASIRNRSGYTHTAARVVR